ncbi:uncharacterized protein LOC135843391 [Planococcus citri]|uniref:uncharacterized protein LOC135843391 n=1 Tax=Planococcus citri TaxID=170843 RepID=UPI0031F91195
MYYGYQSMPNESTTHVDHLACQITDLENEISKRKQIGERAAKIFHDHLTSVYENLKQYETQSRASAVYNLPITSSLNLSSLSLNLSKLREAFTKVINLRIKLAEMIPSTESTSSTEAKEVQSILTKQPNIEKLLRKQSFLIIQIESLEEQGDICPTKAEVMYDHVSKLYDSYISNHIQIEENIDDSATLEIQQKISTDVQAKVIDFQTKLKKIIKSIASTSISQPDEANLNSEIRSSTEYKTPFQPKQTLQSSESENTLRSMNLKLSNLESLYEDLWDSQKNRYNEETSTDNSEILDSLNDNLDISKDIKNKMTCLEEAQRKLREDNERSERNILDKLNQILQMNGSQSSLSAYAAYYDNYRSSLQKLETNTLEMLQPLQANSSIPSVPRKSRFS